MSEPQFQTLYAKIGNTSVIPGFPGNDLAGLFCALEQWTLDPIMRGDLDDHTHPHAEFKKPFRTLAWNHCRQEPIPNTNLTRYRYVGTKPIYDEQPRAVRYCGGFLQNSFHFIVDTSDELLIDKLDQLIAANMARPEFVSEDLRVNRKR